MNILVYGAPYFEFQLATIVDGFKSLGHTVFDVRNEGRNYMELYKGEPVDVFIDAFPHERFKLEYHVPIKIMVWPYDLGEKRKLIYTSYDFDLIFVRDYFGDGPENVFPLNYGIEERYFCFIEKEDKPLIERYYDVVYMGDIVNVGKRLEYCERVEKQCSHRNLLIGSKITRAKEVDAYWSRWVNGRFTHNTDYYRTLADSKILLSLHGSGIECGRTYEAIASHALPLIEYSNAIQITPSLKDNIPEIFFRTPNEMIQLIDVFLNDLNYAQEIADAVFEFGKTHLLSKHRVNYIIEKVNKIREVKINNVS
jgi:hypothetical protein